jgi:hypothetical protein
MNFDSKYWIRYTGLDGYMFLKYERAILKMLILLCLLSFSVYIPINFLSEEPNWLLITVLKNKPESSTAAWAHTIVTIIYACIGFNTVIGLQTKFKKEFNIDFLYRSRKENTEWLKARTAHVIGLNPNDRKACLVRNVLNNYLSKFGGKVLDEKIIPDYQKMVEIEQDKKCIEVLHGFMQSKKKRCNDIFIDEAIKNPNAYKLKMQYFDRMLQRETEKPFLSSGNAFVCFDSLENLERCVRHFSKHSFRGFCSNCWRTMKEFLYNNVLSQRQRALSTFGRYATMDAEAEAADPSEENINIVITKAPEPIDINWLNMKGLVATNSMRRVLLNLIAILVLFFLTTPTMLFHQIASIGSTNLFKFDWLAKYSLGSALASYLPPLIILGLNQILLLLIDLMARWEKHTTFSDYQIAMLNKSTPYFIVNMLIMPAISMATASNMMIRVIL